LILAGAFSYKISLSHGIFDSGGGTSLLNSRLLIGTAICGLFFISQTPAFAASQPHRTSAAPSTYHFTESEIILNGKTVVAKAARFVNDATSYVSLYDAELLVNKITGDNNKTDTWNGIKKTWDIEFTHGIPSPVKNSHGSATFYINNQEVIHAPIIITHPNGDPSPTTFVPIWYVQQVINQLIISTQTHADVWDGAISPAKWVISYSSTFGATDGGSMHPVTVQNIQGSAPGGGIWAN
jgi:hypothetical protein